MSLFTFHVSPDFPIHLGAAPLEDVELELADLAEARRQAIELCGELLRDHSDAFASSRSLTVTVIDTAGLDLCVVGCTLERRAAIIAPIVGSHLDTLSIIGSA